MMKHNYPYEFTLESGTHVVVQKEGKDAYAFTLTPPHGPASQFTYVEDERPKAAWDNLLEFEQLDALRIFWLEKENIV